MGKNKSNSCKFERAGMYYNLRFIHLFVSSVLLAHSLAFGMDGLEQKLGKQKLSFISKDSAQIGLDFVLPTAFSDKPLSGSLAPSTSPPEKLHPIEENNDFQPIIAISADSIPYLGNGHGRQEESINQDDEKSNVGKDQDQAKPARTLLTYSGFRQLPIELSHHIYSFVDQEISSLEEIPAHFYSLKKLRSRWIKHRFERVWADSHTIKDLEFTQNHLYLATGQGLKKIPRNLLISKKKSKSKIKASQPDDMQAEKPQLVYDGKVTSVSIENDTILLGTPCGIAVSIDGGNSFKKYQIDDIENQYVVQAKLFKGKIYVVTSQDGLFVSSIDHPEFSSSGSNHFLENTSIQHIVVSESGIYVATNFGIAISNLAASDFHFHSVENDDSHGLEPPTLKRHSTTEQDFFKNRVYSIQVDDTSSPAAPRIIIAAESGLYMGSYFIANDEFKLKKLDCFGPQAFHGASRVGQTVCAYNWNGMYLSLDGGKTFISSQKMSGFKKKDPLFSKVLASGLSVITIRGKYIYLNSHEIILPRKKKSKKTKFREASITTESIPIADVFYPDERI